MAGEVVPPESTPLSEIVPLGRSVAEAVVTRPGVAQLLICVPVGGMKDLSSLVLPDPDERPLTHRLVRWAQVPGWKSPELVRSRPISPKPPAGTVAPLIGSVKPVAATAAWAPDRVAGVDHALPVHVDSAMTGVPGVMSKSKSRSPTVRLRV